MRGLRYHRLSFLRGGVASALFLLGLPIVSVRVAFGRMDRIAARAAIAAHFDRFLKLCGARVTLEGDFPQADDGYVLCYNESSFVDVAAFCVVMWPHIDRAAAADLYAYIPFGRRMARKAGIEMVPRGNRAGTERLMAEVVARVRAGERQAWGGEGRIVGMDGIGRFKIGASLIAIRAQVPVIPVTFCGGHQIMPFGGVRARPGLVRVHFGAPVPTSGLTEEDARAFADRLQAVIAGRYAAMKAEETKDEPTVVPA